MTVSHDDQAYAAGPGPARLARVYRSPDTPTTGAPVVVDIHGGAWSNLDRTAGARYDRALAERGYLVVAVDFRQAPEWTHPAASADIVAAIRWIRADADRLGADPARIGLVGSSSGGHLALMAACCPDGVGRAGSQGAGSKGAGSEGAGSEGIGGAGPDASVACVAALWPPVDPAARYRFAREQQAVGPAARRTHYAALVAGSLGYFGDEATMESASIADIVASGRAAALPPLWLCYPSEDANVPRPIVDRLRATWAAAGASVEMTTYHGQVHGFGHHPGGVGAAFVEDLAGFVGRHLGG